jgi:uncharacterized membrane protein YkvA (DUF1232 family)
MKAMNNIIDHATRQAVSLLRDREQTVRLIETARERLRLRPEALQSKGLKAKLQAASRLVLKTVRREYHDVPWQSILLITAGFVYFVMPADAIPDIVPMLGFTDDIAVLTAIFASVSKDLDSFIEWEGSQEGQEEPVPPQD